MSNRYEFLKTVTILDTETTHLYAEKAEIVEIAGAKYTNGQWIVKSTLLGSTDPIPFAASAKNNISRKMIAGLPIFKDKIEESKEILGWDNSSIFIAHNSKYDQAVLFKAFNDAKLIDDANKANDKFNWICTFKLAKQLLTFDFEDMQYNLSYLRYALNLPISDELGVHRAAADTIVTAALLEFLVEYAITKGIINETLDIGKQLNNLCWKPTLVTKWPFGKHKGAAFSDIPTDYFLWCIKKLDALNDKSVDYNVDLAETVRVELEKRVS